MYSTISAEPFLDGLLQHLSSWFNQRHQELLKRFSVVPSVMHQTDSSWKQDFKEFCTLYEDNLPSPHTVSGELHIWDRKWQDAEDESLSATAGGTLAVTNSKM